MLQPLQDLQQVGPCPLNRGDIHPLSGGVDVVELRAEGNAVQPRKLVAEDAALQAGVNGLHHRLPAEELLIYRHHQGPQAGLPAKLPGGICSPGGEVGAVRAGHSLHIRQQGFPCPVQAAAEGNRPVKLTAFQKEDAEVCGGLHQTGDIPRHGDHAAEKAAEKLAVERNVSVAKATGMVIKEQPALYKEYLEGGAN